ncbi:hypothetical protein ACR777_05465 [Sphingobacterium spiritivorum]|uniref:hypothetical protein n=1 Tax=Sphingobacterium spiritivorum TaxID=258 RepID=UPI003DA6AE93
MKELYLSIKEYILDKLPVVLHVDLWNEQIMNIEEEVPFLRPAVFIEFGIVEWTRVNKTQKSGNVPLRLHLVTDCYDFQADGADALQSLDLLNELEGFMDGSALPGCTPMLNTNTQIDNNHGNLIENITSYSFDYTKCIPSKKNLVPVTPNLQVEGEIKKPL